MYLRSVVNDTKISLIDPRLEKRLTHCRYVKPPSRTLDDRTGHDEPSTSRFLGREFVIQLSATNQSVYVFLLLLRRSPR